MRNILISRKAQVTLEAGVIMLYILVVLMTFWLGGPVQQFTEKSTDTNDLILGAQVLDTIASAIEYAGMGGDGQRTDFTVHIPFNTVDIAYGNDDVLGPHFNLTVIVYANISLNSGELGRYWVNDNGTPEWYDVPVNDTPFYYKTITKKVAFQVSSSPFCDMDARKNSTQIRGNITYLRDTDGKPIKLCCEAGFNIQAYIEKDPADRTKVIIKPRYYYSLPGTWNLAI